MPMQLILTQDVAHLGTAGELVLATVAMRRL